jgi:hypothetical protein
MVGRLTMDLDFLKGALKKTTVDDKRSYVDRQRPAGLSVARGCELMNLARSTYYEEPTGQRIEDAVILEMIGEICAQFPCYGYRRVIA